MIPQLAFLLPFFMLIGIGGQLLGLVLFFTLIFFQENLGKKTDFLKASVFFFLIWFVFPLFSLIETLSLKSHMPSSFLIASLGFLALSFKKGRSFEGNKRFYSFMKGLSWALGILFVYTLIQYFFGFDYRYDGFIMPKSETYGSELFRPYRPSGFYGHPLSLTSVCLGLYGFCIFLISKGQKDFKLIFCGSLAFLILLLTGSRMSFLLAAAFLALFFARKTPLFGRFLALFIGFFVVYFSGLWHRFTEIWELGPFWEFPRIVLWKSYWSIFLEKPFLGHGSLAVKEMVRAHNIYLQVLVEIGLLGFGLLSFFFYQLYKIFKKVSNNSIFYQAFVFAFVLNLIHGLTQNTLFDASLICFYFYLLLFSLKKPLQEV